MTSMFILPQGYHQVDLEDRLSERLFPMLDDAFKFIEQARTEQSPASKLLIHCVLGKSRSASVAIAYLVKHHNMTLRDAYRHVLERRRGVVLIRPNRSFVQQLMEWEASQGRPHSTLSWDDVDTGVTNFHEWLMENDVSSKAYLSGSRSKKGNAQLSCSQPFKMVES